MIIKNCPKAIQFPTEVLCQGKVRHCNEICSQHCLLKRIAEKCKEAISTYDNEEFYEDDCDKFLGESLMAQNILELLEIEE